MLYREIITEIHTKHINAFREQNVELLSIETCGRPINHWILKKLNFQIYSFIQYSV